MSSRPRATRRASGSTNSGDDPHLAEPDDPAVIREFLAGSLEATSVIDAWIAAALRSASWSAREDWEDLKQEVRMRVLRNLRAGRFHGDSGLRTYVHSIARNAAVDWLRVMRRRRERDGRCVGAIVPAEQDRVISRDLLDKLLEGLSDEDRQLLDLVHGQHLSYLEISRLLGVAVGTVKARVFRCRQRLLSQRSKLLREKDA